MKRTTEAVVVTELILEVFRFNGHLLDTGDNLGRPVGLTSARWQVLGAIELAGHSLSVSQIARRIGNSRQAVQRIANDLERLDLTTFELNPDHARAKLVAPTKKGWKMLEQINARQIEWSNKLANGIGLKQLNNAVKTLRELQLQCEKLEISAHEFSMA